MNAWMRIGIAALMLAGMAGSAEAARVGVLSNRYAAQAAADLGSRLAGHTFTGVDVSVATPTLASLTAAYDVLLVFADQNFSTAPAVGDVAAGFANAGHAVVLGTFYDQQRSDAGGSGWGALETLDPNTTDGLAVPTPGGQSRTLDTATLVNHPLTGQVASLYGTQWAGGNEAKPGTVVVAHWQQPNARGKPDPAIAFRVTGTACVIQLGIAPHYASLGTLNVNFGGDFYRAWQNAFDFAADGCGRGALAGDATRPVPTLSEVALAALALALAGLAFVERRRLAARR
jgi:hypothetical protein